MLCPGLHLHVLRAMRRIVFDEQDGAWQCHARVCLLRARCGSIWPLNGRTWLTCVSPGDLWRVFDRSCRNVVSRDYPGGGIGASVRPETPVSPEIRIFRVDPGIVSGLPDGLHDTCNGNFYDDCQSGRLWHSACVMAIEIAAL